MTKKPSGVVSPLGMIVGTKAIIPYLRSFMSLNPDPEKAWRTIKDWKKKYKLPIHKTMNSQPAIIPSEIVEFFALGREGLKEGVTKGDFRTMLEKRQ